MFHKPKHTSKPTSGYISRMYLIVMAISLVVLGAACTVYALTTYQPKLVTHADTPTVQTSDNDTSSTTATNTAPTPTPTPTAPVKTAPVQTTPLTTPPPTTPAPAPVVAPSQPVQPTDVQTLTPPETGSNSTTSYQSTNWAGYLATGGSFTTVSGNWIAPSPTGTSTTVESGDGTWVGIGGVSSSDLIQVGTANTVSPSGAVSTVAFYELLPASAQQIVALTITPGDTIAASITQTATNQWTITLTDVTTGQTFSTSVGYASSLSSAEWIQEDPSYANGSLVLLDNFGTVQFSNAMTTMNGVAMSAAASNASKVTLVGQGGAAGHSGTPSSVSGGSFTVQYQ